MWAPYQTGKEPPVLLPANRRPSKRPDEVLMTMKDRLASSAGNYGSGSGEAQSRVRPRVANGVLGIVGAFALAACVAGAGSPSASTRDGMVPFIAATVPPAPLNVTSGRACAAGDIATTPLTFSGYAMGTEAFDGRLTLRSAAGCDLPAEPNAAFRDLSGGPVAIQPAGSSGTRVEISPSSSVDLSLRISNWCALGQQPAGAVVTLLGGDALHATLEASGMPSGAACAGSATYLVTISNRATTPTAAPSAVDELAAALIVSGSAAPGQDYGFDVALTNTGPSPVSFDQCPTYDMGIKLESGYSVSYVLNCAAAQPIGPGATETFHMSIAIPASVSAGSYILTWSLEGAIRGANATVTIT